MTRFRHNIIWFIFNHSPDCLIFFVMTVNKCLTYAVAPSAEVTLNYQTNWNTAQACQRWRLELMTHEKQSRALKVQGLQGHTLLYTINIPSFRWALTSYNYRYGPNCKSVQLPSFRFISVHEAAITLLPSVSEWKTKAFTEYFLLISIICAVKLKYVEIQTYSICMAISVDLKQEFGFPH